ncbi:hypothetical protein S40293_10845 [Stachybotrys chartarum IBT 40293]|nr:hypothetical protein S40293_10845 [Stachybotrys chartarum IBT 40293]
METQSDQDVDAMVSDGVSYYAYLGQDPSIPSSVNWLGIMPKIVLDNISEWLKNVDLTRLARCAKGNIHESAIRTLYLRSAKKQHSSAIFWAAEVCDYPDYREDCITTLDLAVNYLGDVNAFYQEYEEEESVHGEEAQTAQAEPNNQENQDDRGNQNNQYSQQDEQGNENEGGQGEGEEETETEGEKKKEKEIVPTFTPLHIAAGSHNTAFLRRLIEHGARTNIIGSRSLVFEKLEINEQSINNRLKGIDLHIDQDYFVFPLFVSMVLRRLKATELFIASEADQNLISLPEDASFSLTRLHIAVAQDDRHLVKGFLQHCHDDPDGLVTRHGMRTPLHTAITNKNVQLAIDILSFHPNPNFASDDFQTPLMQVTHQFLASTHTDKIREWMKVAFALLEINADANAIGNSFANDTPLMTLIQGIGGQWTGISWIRLHEFVEKIISHGADPWRQGHAGQSPLYVLNSYLHKPWDKHIILKLMPIFNIMRSSSRPRPQPPLEDSLAYQSMVTYQGKELRVLKALIDDGDLVRNEELPGAMVAFLNNRLVHCYPLKLHWRHMPLDSITAAFEAAVTARDKKLFLRLKGDFQRRLLGVDGTTMARDVIVTRHQKIKPADFFSEPTFNFRLDERFAGRKTLLHLVVQRLLDDKQFSEKMAVAAANCLVGRGADVLLTDGEGRTPGERLDTAAGRRYKDLRGLLEVER